MKGNRATLEILRNAQTALAELEQRMTDTRTPQEVLRDARASLAEMERQVDALVGRGMLTKWSRPDGALESLRHRLDELEAVFARAWR